jgi:hydroxyethylthiazole kinase-like uncharacterized protein yjeF
VVGVKIVTADEMRAIDSAAIDGLGIPGVVLMENAGLHVLEAVEELAAPDSRILVICGSGNNGGDGFVVARHLFNRGAHVQVVLLAESGSVKGDAGINFAAARRMGVEILGAPSSRALNRAVDGADILVDGILGTGISGTVRDAALAGIKAAQRCAGRVVAIDIPSGVCADTGAILGEAVRADVTVTFGLPKIGLYTYPGREYCGDIRVADIGLPRELLERDDLRTNLTATADAALFLPPRPLAGHKSDFGRAIIFGGSPGMTGAPALAAQGALRVGAGLVTVGCAGNLNAILEVKLTEAMTRPLGGATADILGPDAVEGALELAAPADVVVLGPGLSREPHAQEFARAIVDSCSVPLVIDADGLFALGDDLQLVKRRQAPTILTPHPGEMSRLCGATVETVQADRLACARRVAAETGAVVVLKGAGTVIADPGGEAWINPTGSNALGSGGTGDVLAGAIGGLAAGGAEAVAAAVAGVYYHGAAGDFAEEHGSGRALVAGDVVDALAAVLPD